MTETKDAAPIVYNPAGVDLAVAALAQIEMHPETWNQSQWRCETGFCLAGWMGELSSEVQWATDSACSFGGGISRTPSGDEHVRHWASRAIFDDPAHPESYELFQSGNTIEDLRAGVKALCNGESVADAIASDREARS